MSYYLQRSYFFDVHPPLGRLLVTLGGYIFGVDPGFEYDEGAEFPPGYRFCALRCYHAIVSSLAPAIALLASSELGLPKVLSFATGMFVALGAYFGHLLAPNLD